MSHPPPNPYHSVSYQHVNSVPEPQNNHSQYQQVPLNQANYPGLKQDPNSNSPHHTPSCNQLTRPISNVNYTQSSNSSPAFNSSPISQQGSSQPSPIKPLPSSTIPGPNSYQYLNNPLPQQNTHLPPSKPNTSISPITHSTVQGPVHFQQAQPIGQINPNAPPLSTQRPPNQSVPNGPPTSLQQSQIRASPVSSPNMYNGPQLNQSPINVQPMSAHNQSMPRLADANMKPISGIVNVPSSAGPPSGPYAPIGQPVPQGLTRPITHVGPSNGPQTSSAGSSMRSTPTGPPTHPPYSTYNSANIGPPLRPGPSMAPPTLPPPLQAARPPLMPPLSGPPMNASVGPPTGPPRPPTTSQMGPQGQVSGQSRYPPMPQYTNHQPHMPLASPQMQYTGPYNTQGLTQQMGQLSVTKQGFNQLWGHQMLDLLTCKQILPEYPEDPPEIKLTQHFADAPNCSPEIFRCTINRIPETNNLLQKSRLPLGILIHPFKDLNHLPVIQCSTIVRCRACRTYINPFVYFVDSKRWKCNLCYRVNDLPEEFQYDPVSKSYGDPSRRPEIKSATIEFIAPGEYMLRPPQPAVYLFLLDISQMARDSGYLDVFCEILRNNLDQLPGDARTQVGLICFDSHIHYYLMSDGLTRPKEMTVLDVDDVFLPSPESLLVNLSERRELIVELLSVLPKRHSGPSSPGCALGAALQAAYKLMAPTGGRVTVFQTCLPNIGPGALTAREDPNARSSKDVAHLNPATDFYKRLALDCSGAQVAVDLFLLNSQYSDLATISGMSKFSGGTVYHIPLFKASRAWHADQLRRMLTRYLTRKIGFEAVMRVRCTRGITIHTFHGNFFVRSTDLLSLPNVSPDSGFGMQLTIEESLSDLQQVCFQAALLYTSSKGERRIRVHTMALPIANTLTDVLHAADQQCIIGLLSKMAVDRCASASMSEAREALINVAVDALSAHRLAQNLPAGDRSAALHAPASLRLLPLYLLALLKRRAFRTGTSTRLDDRVADMCDMKTMPLSQLMRAVYPDLYPIHALAEHVPATARAAGAERETDEDAAPDPPRLHLTAERINSTGAYLLDDGETMILYIGHSASPAFLSDTFGVASFSQVPDEARSLPKLEGEGNVLLHMFIDKLNDDRPYASNLLVLRDNSPMRQMFTERLVDDRVESAFAYYEFLQHIKTQVK